MNEVREAVLNALGLCETLLTVKDEVPDDLAEGAELVKEQLLRAVEILDAYGNN